MGIEQGIPFPSGSKNQLQLCAEPRTPHGATSDSKGDFSLELLWHGGLTYPALCASGQAHSTQTHGVEACGTAGWRGLHCWENPWRKRTKSCWVMGWRAEKWVEVQESNSGYFSREMRGEQHQWGEQKAKTPVRALCEEPCDGPRKEDSLRSEKQVLVLGSSETGLKLLEPLLPPSVELS